MSTPLLIIGQRADRHVEAVLGAIADRFDIHLFDYFSNVETAIDLDERTFHLNGRSLNLDDPIIIWNRVKPNFKRITEEKEETDIEKYTTGEWINFSKSIEFVFQNSIAVNNNTAVFKHKHKAFQGLTAAKCGLSIPKSYFTNRPHGNLDHYALKPIASMSYLDQGGMFTQRLPRAYFEDHSDQLKVCPMILQEYVDKRSEIRVLATQDTAVAVEIMSQHSDANLSDWRVAQQLNSYIPFTITDEFRQKLKFYLRHSELHYGVFDFILKANGELVFIECNADGQWLGYAQQAGNENEFCGALADMFDRLAS